MSQPARGKGEGLLSSRVEGEKGKGILKRNSGLRIYVC